MSNDSTLDFNGLLELPTELGLTDNGSDLEETPTTKRRGRPSIKAPYNRVMARLSSMTYDELNAQAKILFEENHYQRILFYSWIQTIRNCRNPQVNPRYYTPNLIGAPGYGKSGLTYEFGRIMQNWLSGMAGEPIKFEVVVRTLAGINDFCDIMGIVAVDREEWNTRLAPPRAFPKEGDYTFGVVFLDD